MKLLYVTDLHGDKAKYEEVLDLAEKEEIKLIINGGDMLPKHRNISVEQLKFIKDYLKQYFKTLEEMGITYLCMLGNDDLMSFDKPFDQLCNEYKNVINIAQNIVFIDGYSFIGMNYILDTPFPLKDRVVNENGFVMEKQLRNYAVLSKGLDFDYINDWVSYSKNNLINMKDILNSLPIPSDYGRSIYIMHCPPVGLNLGRVHSRDKDVGSIAIHDFIKERKPLLTLHGHIHESPDVINGTWINHIDNTVCINPGQTENRSDELVYSLIDLDKGLYLRKKQEIKSPNKHFI